MNVNRYLFCISFILLSIFCPLNNMGQTSLTEPNLKRPSYISPYYFGPNAFPIPDMLDATVKDKLTIELSGSIYKGYRGDITNDIAIRINVPLFCKKVNLSLWVPFEWWSNSEQNIDVCRLSDVKDSRLHKGNTIGDVYLSTDIQLLTEKKHFIDCTIRAALKSASSYFYFLGRYYDSPGYFFDSSIGKEIPLPNNFIINRLRIVGTVGFLSWQTDNGRQNDALMYGGMLQLTMFNNFMVSSTIGGYSGWEHSLNEGKEAHDRPLSVKTKIEWRIKDFSLFTLLQNGIREYPYVQLKFGVAYQFNILKQEQ